MLSSAGVAVCIACIPTVSVVASVAAIAVYFPLCSVATTAIFLSASIAIFPALSAGYASVVASWVVVSCCIPSVADVVLVVVSVNSIYCLISVVSGVVLPLVVQQTGGLL